jgi:hypothetical protein
MWWESEGECGHAVCFGAPFHGPLVVVVCSEVFGVGDVVEPTCENRAELSGGGVDSEGCQFGFVGGGGDGDEARTLE